MRSVSGQVVFIDWMYGARSRALCALALVQVEAYLRADLQVVERSFDDRVRVKVGLEPVARQNETVVVAGLARDRSVSSNLVGLAVASQLADMVLHAATRRVERVERAADRNVYVLVL